MGETRPFGQRFFGLLQRRWRDLDTDRLDAMRFAFIFRVSGFGGCVAQHLGAIDRHVFQRIDQHRLGPNSGRRCLGRAGHSDPTAKSRRTSAYWGADNGGEAGLTYTWYLLGDPPDPITFSGATNGTNAAKNITATFAACGVYNFRVIIKDPAKQLPQTTLASTVTQILTSVSISPTTQACITAGPSNSRPRLKINSACPWPTADVHLVH